MDIGHQMRIKIIKYYYIGMGTQYVLYYNLSLSFVNLKLSCGSINLGDSRSFKIFGEVKIGYNTNKGIFFN